jgi:hypothetical protein
MGLFAISPSRKIYKVRKISKIMTTDIFLMIDASRSMGSPLGGLEKLSKLKAVTAAVELFFSHKAGKREEIADAKRKKLGVLCYKTKAPLDKPSFDVVYPLRFFPPVPNISRLSEVKPSGNSPLAEAIKECVRLFPTIQSDKKIIAIITGDSMSNSHIKTPRIETEIVPTLKKGNIAVSVLQAGHAKDDEFKPLVNSLQSILMQTPGTEPAIAIAVQQICNWIEAVYSTT